MTSFPTLNNLSRYSFLELGYSRSLSLDLVDQVKNLDATRQFRFTPPTHTLLAFKQALKEFWKEGGLEGRAKRYQENRNILKQELKQIGFRELVPDEYSSYIITSFLCPNDGKFEFKQFYEKLSELGTYNICTFY